MAGWLQMYQFLTWEVSYYFIGLFPAVLMNNNYFKSRLSLIVRVNVVLNRTVVVDSDWRFDNLCGSHLQSQSELYHVSRWYYILWLLITIIIIIVNWCLSKLKKNVEGSACIWGRCLLEAHFYRWVRWVRLSTSILKSSNLSATPWSSNKTP